MLLDRNEDLKDKAQRTRKDLIETQRAFGLQEKPVHAPCMAQMTKPTVVVVELVQRP